MLAFLHWKLLKFRRHLPREARWFDPSSGLTGSYRDQPPRGLREWLDYLI